MAGWEDSVEYNPEQLLSIQINRKQFYQFQRFDKKMVVLHPSRENTKTFHLNLEDDAAVRSKIKILKRGQETLERENPTVRFTFKPQITASELSYGTSNNVVISKPTTRTVIYTYMDKETAPIFQMDQTQPLYYIDNFPYYSICRANGTFIYLDPIRVRRIYEGYQIATEPDEEETAKLAQPTSVEGTKVVFHKDHAEIIHDKSKVVPPRTETQVDLEEASRRMKTYVIPKLQKTGKYIVGEISALADKTAKEKATLGRPKEQEEELAKPKPQGLKFRNLERKENQEKGAQVYRDSDPFLV